MAKYIITYKYTVLVHVSDIPAQFLTCVIFFLFFMFNILRQHCWRQRIGDYFNASNFLYFFAGPKIIVFNISINDDRYNASQLPHRMGPDALGWLHDNKST